MRTPDAVLQKPLTRAAGGTTHCKPASAGLGANSPPWLRASTALRALPPHKEDHPPRATQVRTTLPERRRGKTPRPKDSYLRIKRLGKARGAHAHRKTPSPTGRSTDTTAFTNCGVQVSLLRSSGTKAVVFSKTACRVQVDQLTSRDTARPPLRMVSHRTGARATAGGPFAPIQSPRNRASLK